MYSGLKAERLARYEDLFDLPENMVGEIIDGQLHTHPRPAPAHARASSALGVKVGNPFDQGTGGPGGWWILDEPELHLNADIFVPDLAGWRRERMPALPGTAWFESNSPSSARPPRKDSIPRPESGFLVCGEMTAIQTNSSPFRLSLR